MAANDLASLVVKTELINTGFVGPMRENSRVAREFQREMGKSAAAGQAGSKSMSRFGVITQQAGYQAQDFAVQVAAGQSAMVALAQQGSQMLGVFGAGGAVAGAVLAIGVLVARLSGIGDSAKKSREEVEELTRSIINLNEARLGSLITKSPLETQAEIIKRQVEENQKQIDKQVAALEKNAQLMAHYQDAAKGGMAGFRENKVVLLTKFEGETMRPNTALEKTIERQREISTKINELAKERIELEDKLAGTSTKITENKEESLLAIDSAYRELTEQVIKENDEIAKSNAKLMSEEIKNSIKAGQARADQARKTAASINEAEAKALEDRIDMLLSTQFYEIDSAEKVKEKVSDLTREMNSMWNSVSDRAGQAFADMILTGENAFNQLADIVARSMLEIVTRMAIINPLLNSIFGLSGSSILPAFFGVGKLAGSASGGNFGAGDVKLVGENGPELFTSDRAGTIHQAGATRGMMKGNRSGGDVFNNYYSFSAGVTHREVAQMIPVLIKQTKSSILDARARGAPA